MRHHNSILGVATSLVLLVPAGCTESPAVPESVRDSPADGLAAPPVAAQVIPGTTTPFGVFGGVPFVQHSGIFEGETSRGSFRMPYQIVAPQDATMSSGTIFLEPAHWLVPTIARDFSLSPEFLFGERYVYAAVGWGDDGTNVLDPDTPDLILAGAPVVNPGGLFRPNPILDEEIIDQFARALRAGALSEEVTGPIERIYGFGISQTANAMLELQQRLLDEGASSPFDLWYIDIALWNDQFRPGSWEYINGDFEPATGLGPVILLSTEGDILIANSGQFAVAADLPDHRVYEVAGASHSSPVAPPALAIIPVVRALLTAGDAWVRTGAEPPASRLLTRAPSGEIDPLYLVETGIARDGDLNALGGVRTPGIAVGQGRYVALDLATGALGLPSQYNVLSGSYVDLTCEPRPGSDSDAPRFRNHGSYVAPWMQQVSELLKAGLLLEADAEVLREQAAESSVGKPRTC